MTSILPRRVYDAIVAKAPKLDPDQSVTVHINQQPNEPKIDEKKIAEAVVRHLQNAMRRG